LVDELDDYGDSAIGMAVMLRRTLAVKCLHDQRRLCKFRSDDRYAQYGHFE
jgi:hypothetical protein